MLNLPRPTSFYFETCRQILWARLTFDKLYILYSDDAKRELMGLWKAALDVMFANTGQPLVDTYEMLDMALQKDDVDWRQFTRALESRVDIACAVNDYFLGASYDAIMDGFKDGDYDAS